MNKPMIVLLAVCVLITGSACSTGSNNPGGNGSAWNNSNGNASPGNDFITSTALEKGREFNAFYFLYTEPEYSYSSLLLSYGNSAFEDVYDSIDYMQVYDRLGRCNIYLDALSAFDEFYYFEDIAPGQTHLLDHVMITGLEGSKQTDGDVITALIDSVYGSDSRWFEAAINAGDQVFLEAKLDSKNLTLCCKITFTRAGRLVNKSEFEVVILPDGTRLFQFVHVENLYEYNDFQSGYAVFKRYDNDSFACVVVETGWDPDLTLSSIIGRGDVSVEQMAGGFMGKGDTHLFKVENGKAYYE
ncbi:MAG: hypothetical protein FWH50_02890 [Coriobacteriia bacterium]|nr:hypothetical protein [Coriobacteriia bacterium]